MESLDDLRRLYVEKSNEIKARELRRATEAAALNPALLKRKNYWREQGARAARLVATDCSDIADRIRLAGGRADCMGDIFYHGQPLKLAFGRAKERIFGSSD